MSNLWVIRREVAEIDLPRTVASSCGSPRRPGRGAPRGNGSRRRADKTEKRPLPDFPEGKIRSALSVGHGVAGSDGGVARVQGYLVDSTQARRAETEVEVQVALARIAVNREAIDEAKGMVMIATGCGSEAALACLRRCSQDANIKVVEIARRLVETVGPNHRGGDFVMAFLDDLGRSSRRLA
jgi:hypothetical protein